MIKNRIFYYDFLRAFAIIAVILCHVDGCYEFTTASLKLSIPFLLNDIGLMGVPIFLMLTGALILNRQYTLGEYFKKRFPRIFYPFIFWVIILSIAGVMFINWDTTQIYRLVFGIKRPTWYIWMIFGIYLFIPIINSFLKEYKLKGLEFFLVIWLVTILLNTFGLYPFNSFELSYFAGYIGFVVLGYYLDKKEFRLSSKVICCLSFILLVVSTALHFYMSFHHMPYLSPKYFNIIIVLQSVGMYLFIRHLDKISIGFNTFQNKSIGKAIVSLSICSYGMYFAHIFFYLYVRQFNVKSVMLLPVILIAVVLLSWAVTYIFSKIPLIKKVCGV